MQILIKYIYKGGNKGAWVIMGTTKVVHRYVYIYAIFFWNLFILSNSKYLGRGHIHAPTCRLSDSSSLQLVYKVCWYQSICTQNKYT